MKKHYSDKKANFTYKTINLVNKKYYYGAHGTDDPFNDSYIGSGSLLKKAIKKYGKENFEFVILKNYKTAKEMFDAEEKLITKEVVDDPMSYNIMGGGLGNSRVMSEKARDRISKTLLGRTKHTHQYLAKMAEAKIGQTKHNNESIAKMAKKKTGMTKQVSLGARRTAISRSKGVYLTPFGSYYSIKDAGKALSVGYETIRNWCVNKNSEKIVQNPRTTQPILTLDNVFGKTYKEAGFSFLPYPENIISFEDRKEFCEVFGVSFGD